MMTATSAMIREITRTTRMRSVLRSARIPRPPGTSGVLAPPGATSSCKALILSSPVHSARVTSPLDTLARRAAEEETPMPDVATERLRSEAPGQRTTEARSWLARFANRVSPPCSRSPGGHILPFLDACLDERDPGHRHPPRGAAVLAAEGWALATGETGVATVTAGPGFANGLIGLLDAAAWSVPLVMVSGRTGHSRQGRGAVMDIDQCAVAAPSRSGRPRARTPAACRAMPPRRCTGREAAAPARSTSRWTPTRCTSGSAPGHLDAGIRPGAGTADRRRRGCRRLGRRARDGGSPGHRRRERGLLVGSRRCDRALRRAGRDPSDHRKRGSRGRRRTRTPGASGRSSTGASRSPAPTASWCSAPPSTPT